MARCGCNSFPVCSCVLAGDGLTTSVAGNGAGMAPFTVTVLDYPNPRPIGTGWLQTQETLVDGVAEYIEFDGGIGAPPNHPSSMWVGGDPVNVHIREDGLYLIIASFRTDDTGGFFSTSSGTQRGHIEIRVNAAAIAFRDNGFKQPAIPNQNGNISLMTLAFLNDGDTVQMVVQLNGMIDALTGPALNRASLQVRWMGLTP